MIRNLEPKGSPSLEEDYRAQIEEALAKTEVALATWEATKPQPNQDITAPAQLGISVVASTVVEY